jgi:hypothetical protein
VPPRGRGEQAVGEGVRLLAGAVHAGTVDGPAVHRGGHVAAAHEGEAQPHVGVGPEER